MLTEVAPDWGRAVYHVLAHVALPEPGATFEPDYLHWCAAHQGPANGRTLGEDARAISELVAEPEVGQRLQLLAWLFDRPQDGLAAARAGLDACVQRTQLSLLGLDDPSVAPALELLVCATALELDVLARLPAVQPDSLERLSVELDVARSWAPWLGTCVVRVAPALWRRGRLVAGEIWVGDPSNGRGPGLEHVVWQVCHEATVGEVRGAAPDMAERDVESVALALLEERAVEAGQALAHHAWLSRLTVPTALTRLSDDQAALLAQLRDSARS